MILGMSVERIEWRLNSAGMGQGTAGTGAPAGVGPGPGSGSSGSSGGGGGGVGFGGKGDEGYGVNAGIGIGAGTSSGIGGKGSVGATSGTGFFGGVPSGSNDTDFMGGLSDALDNVADVVSSPYGKAALSIALSGNPMAGMVSLAKSALAGEDFGSPTSSHDSASTVSSNASNNSIETTTSPSTPSLSRGSDGGGGGSRTGNQGRTSSRGAQPTSKGSIPYAAHGGTVGVSADLGGALSSRRSALSTDVFSSRRLSEILNQNKDVTPFRKTKKKEKS